MGAERALCVVLAVCVSGCLAYNMDLATLLKARQQQQGNHAAQKRGDGNPCDDPGKPFPCKGSSTCIPMGYVCDQSEDCETGYDENPEVCTAVNRPPVVDIMNFLNEEKDWILPMLFGDKPIAKVAHGLAVSQTVNDFRRRLGLSKMDVENLRTALEAVKEKDQGMMLDLGMPANAWQDLLFIFSKLVKSGFQ